MEIFLFDANAPGSGITQITDTTGGRNAVPSINADGNRIAFRSDRDLTGGNAESFVSPAKTLHVVWNFTPKIMADDHMTDLCAPRKSHDVSIRAALLLK